MKWIKSYENLTSTPLCENVKEDIEHIVQDLVDDISIDMKYKIITNTHDVRDTSIEPIRWVQLDLSSYSKFTLGEIYTYLERILKYCKEEGSIITRWKCEGFDSGILACFHSDGFKSNFYVSLDYRRDPATWEILGQLYSFTLTISWIQSSNSSR